MRHILTMVFVATLTACSRSSSQTDSHVLSVDALVAEVWNGDVTWDGQYSGLVPFVTGATAQQLLSRGMSAESVLIAALDDSGKFVAAHVLLTKMNGGSYGVSTSAWNGLRVDLMADGRAIFFPEQRAELQRYWAARTGG